MISKSQVKYIQSLGHKKYRDEDGVFVAEGPKLVEELLFHTHAEPVYLYALHDWVNDNEKFLQNINVTVIEEQDIRRLTLLKTPHQVVAVFKKFQQQKAIETKEKISLVLDTIQDPGNLGTITRIADWFGVPQIICSPDCADAYNPKTIQATMGSIARVKIFYCDLPEWLKQQKIQTFAAMLEGRDVTKMEPLKEGLILIGNESKGIQPGLLPYVHEKITIPKKGKAESLNAAVATGIILSRLA